MIRQVVNKSKSLFSLSKLNTLSGGRTESEHRQNVVDNPSTVSRGHQS